MTSDSFFSKIIPKRIARRLSSATLPDGFQAPGKRTEPLKSLSRSSTLIAAGSAEPKSSLDARLITPLHPRTINVVLFGETGVGKSSVINLIARKVIARVSSDVNGSTMQVARYDISFDNVDYSIFDTIGLEEPQFGINGYLKALEEAYEFVTKLSASGGVHLLLFVMRAGRITATTQSNYRLFTEVVCQTKVPIALVFTGLEREPVMEDWWMRNRKYIEDYGIKSEAHACVTAVQGDDPDDYLKYAESKERIRELLKDCRLKNEVFLPEADSWFARIGNGMQLFIAKNRIPKKKYIMKVLTQDCKLDPETAAKLIDVMERKKTTYLNSDEGRQAIKVILSDSPPDLISGKDEDRPLARTRDKERATDSPKPDSHLSGENDEGKPLARTEIGKTESGPPKPNSTTTNIKMLEANMPGERAINKMEALVSVRDLTGHVTKSSNHPFASGSFGDIYKGDLNRRGKTISVVIKTHRLYVQDDEHVQEKMKQLRKELAVWLGLEHPNVLPLLGTVRNLGMNPYLPAMVCPWVENGTLTTYLEKNKHLTVPQRMTLVNGVAHGLRYLHSKHIIHGDLSGSNVLVYADGRACIADFGLSVLLTRLEGSTFAMSCQDRGTVRWAAPELFRFDDSNITPSTRSDVYSFGSIMLQILTGDVPYHHITREAQVILAVGTGQAHKQPDETAVTDDRWQFMEWCWTPVDAAKPRPTSDEIVEFTEKDLAEIITAAV